MRPVDVDPHRVAHLELVTLQASLELFETIIGEPYRLSISVHRGYEAAIRHGAMVFGTVSNGEAWMQEQTASGRACFRQHGRGAFSNFLWRLRRHDQM